MEATVQQTTTTTHAAPATWRGFSVDDPKRTSRAIASVMRIALSPQPRTRAATSPTATPPRRAQAGGRIGAAATDASSSVEIGTESARETASRTTGDRDL